MDIKLRNEYELRSCGIVVREDGAQEWVITFFVKAFKLYREYAGCGENWREISDEKSHSVGDRDHIARLNSIVSVKALELIPAGIDEDE